MTLKCDSLILYKKFFFYFLIEMLTMLRELMRLTWREVAQSCPTLCDPMGCSLPGSSVHGIFQAIVLEWIAISFSRGSSQPRDRTQVSRIVDRRFTVGATREVQKIMGCCKMFNNLLSGKKKKKTWLVVFADSIV